MIAEVCVACNKTSQKCFIFRKILSLIIYHLDQCTFTVHNKIVLQFTTRLFYSTQQDFLQFTTRLLYNSQQDCFTVHNRLVILKKRQSYILPSMLFEQSTDNNY